MAISRYPAGSPRKDVVYTNAAFDIGTVVIGAGDKATTLHVMNEYMAIDDAGGTRLATFPDVITTLDKDGEPLSVGQLHVGMTVHVLHVPKAIIPALGRRARPLRLSAGGGRDGHRDRPLCV